MFFQSLLGLAVFTGTAWLISENRKGVKYAAALSGFANFGSLGILLGGLGSLAPERRDELVGLGMKALVAGTLATCMTGAVIGIFT